MNNKGQSALEFLWYYGWAFVVIIIVVVALFAFGIFDRTFYNELGNEERKVIWKDTGEEITEERYNELNGICYARCVDAGNAGGRVKLHMHYWSDIPHEVWNYCNCEAKPICELVEKCSVEGVCDFKEQCYTLPIEGVDLFTIGDSK